MLPGPGAASEPLPRSPWPSWPPSGTPRGRVLTHPRGPGANATVAGTAVRARRLAGAGVGGTPRRSPGSSANTEDRGHAPSPGRLVDDVGSSSATSTPGLAASRPRLAGISWGRVARPFWLPLKYPERVAAIALICPGMQPRVGVSRGERLRIALAYFTGRRRKAVPDPPGRPPALFTASPEGRAFIAADPPGPPRGDGRAARGQHVDRLPGRAGPPEGRPARAPAAGHRGSDRRQRSAPASTSSGSPAPTRRSWSTPGPTTPWSSSPTRVCTRGTWPAGSRIAWPGPGDESASVPRYGISFMRARRQSADNIS